MVSSYFYGLISVSPCNFGMRKDQTCKIVKNIDNYEMLLG